MRLRALLLCVVCCSGCGGGEAQAPLVWEVRYRLSVTGASQILDLRYVQGNGTSVRAPDAGDDWFRLVMVEGGGEFGATASGLARNGMIVLSVAATAEGHKDMILTEMCEETQGNNKPCTLAIDRMTLPS